MPIVESLMDDLVKRYGEDEGRRIYHAMEAEGKGPFGPKGKYRRLHEEWAARHGVAPVTPRRRRR